MQVAAVELSVLVPIVLALKEIAIVMQMNVKQVAAKSKKLAVQNN